MQLVEVTAAHTQEKLRPRKDWPHDTILTASPFKNENGERLYFGSQPKMQRRKREETDAATN